jgi:primosomal protein N' (replication factor Y) (superfamily II helicase)
MSAPVRVVFPLPLRQSFLYAVPDRLLDRARPGCRVRAPLGRKDQVGFIVPSGAEAAPEGLALKEILEVLDERPFWEARFLAFTGALSAEFHSSWGEILQASLPPSLSAKTKVTAVLTEAGRTALEGNALRPREKAVASLLLGYPKGRSPVFLQRKAGLKSVAPLLARLEAKKLVEVRETVAKPPRPAEPGAAAGSRQLPLDFGPGRPPSGILSPVEAAVEAGRFAAFCLRGSRPALAAAYRDLIRRSLSRSGRTLFLVPEVALTREFASGFEAEFGRAAAVFHGRMTERQKETAWRGISSGRTALVAGTRSALFLAPGPLTLIIVDDEHEESYAQSESPAYDARRGAWLRARAEGAVVVLGSPRPSIEASEAATRADSLLELGGPVDRAEVTWVDHRTDAPVLSRELGLRVAASLKRDEPVILFLNRRGYAASLTCQSCGRVPGCRRCDIPLVYHKKDETLVCHYCNASLRASAGCPSCGGRLTLRRGAGTQALEEEIKALLPGVPVARFDADAAPGREERDGILHDFARGRIAVLVATELLAHQPGAPRVRLVGILSPESLLGLSDYRASQRTFQSVSRMCELCETAAGAGVVVQTPAPVHYSIRAAATGDYGAFFEREAEFRKLMNYPPYAALAEVTIQGREMRALAAAAREFRAGLRAFEPEVEVLGPALASVVRVRDLVRVQVILKARRRDSIDRALDAGLPRLRLRTSVAFSYAPFG